MNKISLLLFVCLTCCFFRLNAQILVFLNNQAGDTLRASFFVKDIKDSRTEKSRIGDFSGNGSVQPVEINGGLRNSLLGYCDKLILFQDNQWPIEIIVSQITLKLDSARQRLTLKTEINFSEPKD